MTTAARPTFEPAKGGRGKGEGDLSALSKQYSSRDLPSHTKLKYRLGFLFSAHPASATQADVRIFLACRQTGQGTSEEVKTKDLRRELEERERDVRAKRGRDKPRSFTGERRGQEISQRIWWAVCFSQYSVFTLKGGWVSLLLCGGHGN